MTAIEPRHVPFFRPDVSDAEVAEVAEVLRSGWLTTGPRVKRFEEEFAAAVGASHALALNSCTAALHLAVEALGLNAECAVLVPSMTFAATAEVVRYLGAVPVLVDCDPVTLNMDLVDAARKAEMVREGRLPFTVSSELRVAGIIPVHVGGLMMDVAATHELARDLGAWVVDDAAHSFPAAWRRPDGRWQRCGEGTAAVSCFSFYANKTITTGEGGMAVTDSEELMARMRVMALHGLSRDAWERYSGGASWDYRIVAPGFKYNMTDVAAALGLGQLARAEQMRARREAITERYRELLGGVEELELPPADPDRVHSWHLFAVRLRLDRLRCGRDEFVEQLRRRGIGFSVHWRPLHLHPYYEGLGWRPEHCPAASAVWPRLVSLPLFPSMTEEEVDRVVEVVKELCAEHRKPSRA